MRKTLPALLLAPTLFATALAWPAVAQPISAERAGSLEAQLRTWLAGLVGEAAVPARPVEVTPAGSNYQVAVPLAPVFGSKGAMTATLRPLQGGTWALDAITFPSPTEITMTLPITDARGGTKTETITSRITIESQSGNAVIDPTLATPSTLVSSYKNLVTENTTRGNPTTTRIGSYAGQSSLRPAGSDRVDFSAEGVLEGYSGVGTLPEGRTLQLDARRIRVDGELTGLAHAQVPVLIRSVSTLIGGLMPGGKGTIAPPGSMPDRAALRSLVMAMDGMASGGKLDEVIEDVRVRTAGFDGTLKRLRIGFDVGTPEGLLVSGMDLSMEGPAVAQPPLGPYAAFIPSQVSLRPTLSGIASADLMKLLRSLTEDNAPMPDLDALFARGGPIVGIENLVLVVGKTRLSGQGRLTAPSPAEAQATAQLTATNMDALIDQAKTVPEFGPALPVLILAKGIGRTTPIGLTWDVSYSGGKVLVNGTDLSAMAGGGAPAQGQQPGPGRPKR